LVIVRMVPAHPHRACIAYFLYQALPSPGDLADCGVRRQAGVDLRFANDVLFLRGGDGWILLRCFLCGTGESILYAGGVYGIPRHATCQRQNASRVSAGSAQSGRAGAMTPAVIVSGAQLLSLYSGPHVTFGLSTLSRAQVSQLAWGTRVVQRSGSGTVRRGDWPNETLLSYNRSV
jgi:hypothetical protein